MSDKIHRYFMTLKKPEDVYNLSLILASSFPVPEKVITGIYELLLNAIEHGNLEIGHDDKHSLIQYNKLQQEIQDRLRDPRYNKRCVTIELVETPCSISIRIMDEGNGFDWKKFLKHNLHDKSPHGRGIWIAQNAAFDAIEFNPQGNCVTCFTTLSEPNMQ